MPGDFNQGSTVRRHGSVRCVGWEMLHRREARRFHGTFKHKFTKSNGAN